MPQMPGERLAKRKAREESLVKFGFCPISSEFSTGYYVRGSDGHSARALAGAVGSLSRTVQSRVPLGERTLRVRVPQRLSVFFF